jgi:hypothetical protein
MANQDTSAKDLLELVALPQGKQPSEFGLQSFENKDGGYSVAIVNLVTSSLVLQANGLNEQECYNKLADALEAGPVTHVDPAVAPVDNPPAGSEVGPGWGAADTKVPHGTDVPAFTAAPGVMTNDEVIANLPKNDNGQVVINENGEVEGLEADNQPAPGNASATQASNSDQTPAAADPNASSTPASSDKAQSQATQSPAANSAPSTQNAAPNGTASTTATNNNAPKA